MSFFRYEAIDRAGKVVTGAMDAPDTAAVATRLAQMGFTARAVMPAPGSASNRALNGTAGAKSSKTRALPPSNLGGAKPKDLALFFRQFAALVRSGITLFQALDNLGPRSSNPALAETAREMAETARSGGRVSDVMERYPRLFAPHVVAAVRAGELGGFLEIVLDEIALDYEQEIAFYKGMWLPKALVVQGFLAIAIAQPLFPTLFPNAQFARYFLLAFGRNLPIAILIVLLVRWIYGRMQQPNKREKRDALAMRVPVFGDLARQKALASFVRTLRRLFAAGVAPISAWEGAMNVASNSLIREKLAEAYELMQKGTPLHEAFASTGLFANETEQLIATGVVSGQMVDMLDRVAEYYQSNVDRAFAAARFWMYRLGITATIVLAGVLLIMMFKTYFEGIFNSPLVQPD